MTKTESCQLPQWEASDPVRRGDFNDAMSVIDAGLARKDYAMGSYVGQTGTVTVDVGFAPSAVLIQRIYYTDDSDHATGAIALITREMPYASVTFTDTGFTVGASTRAYPRVNQSGQTHLYIAFR